MRQISEYCGTSMEALTSIPQDYEEMNVFHAFYGAGKNPGSKAVHTGYRYFD